MSMSFYCVIEWFYCRLMVTKILHVVQFRKIRDLYVPTLWQSKRGIEKLPNCYIAIGSFMDKLKTGTTGHQMENMS